MKFLLDENVDRRLVAFLEHLGHDVKAIPQDYPYGIEDSTQYGYKQLYSHRKKSTILTLPMNIFYAHCYWLFLTIAPKR